MAYKIQLLRGGHDQEGAPAGGYNAGDVFVAKTNLAKRDRNKFRLIGQVPDSELRNDDDPPPDETDEDEVPEIPAEGDDPEAPEVTLESLKKSELLEIARDEQISNVNDSMNKSEIIHAIRKARGTI